MKTFSIIFFSISLFLSISAQTKITAQQSNSTEIICPSHLEFEFPQRIYNDFDLDRGGYPIACFKEAKIEGNKLIAVYDYNLATYEDFGLSWNNGVSNTSVPNFIELQLKYKDTFYKDWKLMDPVKIDRTNKGWLILTEIVSEESANTIPNGWYGATFSKTVQNNYQPKIYMEFEGVAKVNEDRTGFIVANSIVELNENEDDILLNPDKENLNKVFKKPVSKIEKKNPTTKKISKTKGKTTTKKNLSKRKKR